MYLHGVCAYTYRKSKFYQNWAKSYRQHLRQLHAMCVYGSIIIVIMLDTKSADRSERFKHASTCTKCIRVGVELKAAQIILNFFALSSQYLVPQPPRSAFLPFYKICCNFWCCSRAFSWSCWSHWHRLCCQESKRTSAAR